jgi:hypothetical protein
MGWVGGRLRGGGMVGVRCVRWKGEQRNRSLSLWKPHARKGKNKEGEFFSSENG